MTKQGYIKLSEALSIYLFFVSDRANEIIHDLVAENADKDGYVLKKSLYGDTDDPDYIWVRENNTRVAYLCKSGSQIFVGIQDDSCWEDEAFDINLSDLNPLDKIVIADYMAQRFFIGGYGLLLTKILNYKL